MVLMTQKKEIFFFFCFSVYFFSLISYIDKWEGSWFYKNMISGNSSEMIIFSKFSIFFLIFSGSVVLSVFLFSKYYMPEEDFKIFFLFLFLFLILMWVLVLGGNMSTIFIGWEGVGVMSFLLIGWFSCRDLASFSSKKAVLINRFTDFFFFFMLMMEIKSGGLFFLKKIYLKPVWGKNDYFYLFLILMLSLSFFGKSAQFFFHPWLTSAMEGPTPVSSLLHSSTMVVAGVYLYLMMENFFEDISYLMMMDFNKILSCFFCLTMIFMSISGFFFKDFKKIIALSTTSQLSFMMILCSFGEKELAFLHMMLHSFFKASLFFSSGFVIHNNFSDQDSRSAKFFKQKFQKSAFFFSSLGLLGAPFIGAFMSKHCFISQSEDFFEGKVNFMILCLSLISLCLTSGYSIRMFMNSNLFLNSNLTKPSISESEMNIFMNVSIFNLSLGFLFFGIVFMNFWKNFLKTESFHQNSLQNFNSSWLFVLIIISGMSMNFLLGKNSWMSIHYYWSMEMIYLVFNKIENISKMEMMILEKNYMLRNVSSIFSEIYNYSGSINSESSIKSLSLFFEMMILFLFMFFLLN